MASAVIAAVRSRKPFRRNAFGAAGPSRRSIFAVTAIPAATCTNSRASRLVEDLASVRDWLAARGHTRIGLVASSMGGFAAAWFAKQYPDCVVGCVFVAPGFGFLDRRWEELTPGAREEWQRTGRLTLTNQWVDAELGYGLVEERDRFRPVQLVAGWRTPSLLFHGLADEVVPYTDSLFFIRNVGYSHMELRLLKDGDHRLTAYKDVIASATGAFFAKLLGS